MEGTLLFELGIYVFILGLTVQSIYRIFRPILETFTGWFTRPPKKGESIIPIEDAIITQDKNFGQVFSTGGREDSPEAPMHFVDDRFPIAPAIEPNPTWSDLLIPPLIGAAVAWVFWPLTIFYYLPFQPQFPVFAFIATALVISRISNAEHDTFKTVGQLFIGLINRISPFH